MIPISQVDLRGIVGRSLGCPGDAFSIGRKTGQTIKSVGRSHTYGLRLPCGVDDIQLKILKTMLVGIENQVLAGRMIKRRPAHLFHIGNRSLLATVNVHRHDFGS